MSNTKNQILADKYKNIKIYCVSYNTKNINSCYKEHNV